MKYVSRDKRFRLINILSFSRRNSFSVKSIFYILVALMFFSIEIKNKNYFNELKDRVLNSSLVKLLDLPSRAINKTIEQVYNSFFKENSSDFFKEEHRVSHFDFIRLQQENEELKDLLAFVEKKNFKIITTPLILMRNNNFSQYGIVNIGESHGIKNGYAVLSKGGLVGRITHVSKNMSKILFIYDPSFRTSAKLLNAGVEVIVSGKNNKQKLELIYINDLDELNNSDYVVTVGDLPHFPPGLFIGRFEAPNLVIVDLVLCKLNFVGIVIPDS